MKSIVLILFLLISIFSIGQQNDLFPSNEYVTSNVLLIRRNYFNDKKFKYNFGTAFIVNYKSKTFLVTAKHIFADGVKNKDFRHIDIYIDSKWKTFKENVYIHTNSEIDIVVMPLEDQSEKGMNFSEKCAIGQNAFILGFPNFFKMEAPEISRKPIPLMKKGVFSGFVKQDSISVILVDIVNNKGFSGGPLMVYNYDTKLWSVFGVVSGKLKNPNPNNINFHEQGFTICYSVKYIKEIIEQISN